MLFGRKGHFPMRMRTIMFRPALIPMTKLRSRWVKGKVIETLTNWGSSVNKSGITFRNDMRFSWWENLIASVIEMVQSIQGLGGDLDSKLFWIFLLVKKFWSGTSVCNVLKNNVMHVLSRRDIEKFPQKYSEHMNSSLNMAFETSYRV